MGLSFFTQKQGGCSLVLCLSTDEKPATGWSYWGLIETDTGNRFKWANSAWEQIATGGPGGDPAWGDLTGTLADQTDLQSALNAKASSSHDHDGTYSPVAHNHDGSYSATGHNHDGTYATAAHNHDAAYSPIAHDHSGVYAPALGADDNYVTDAEKVKLGNLSGTNTGDQNITATKLDDFAAPDDNADLDASTARHGLLKKLPGGTSTFLRGDGAFAAPTASVAISTAEIDLGASPVAEATITVTDAAVSAQSHVIAQVAWEAPTGKDIDELEMDDIVLRCKPAAGSFDVFVRAADGSYLADKFKINYLVG